MPNELMPVDVFRLLSDDTRLTATLLIHIHGELCVCELTESLKLSQPKISRHLAQLRAAGLLKDSRRGQWVYYSLEQSLPVWVTTVLDAALQANQKAVQNCTYNLYAMLNRPRCC